MKLLASMLALFGGPPVIWRPDHGAPLALHPWYGPGPLQIENHCIVCTTDLHLKLGLWNRNPDFRLRPYGSGCTIQMFLAPGIQIAWAPVPAPLPWFKHMDSINLCFFRKFHLWIAPTHVNRTMFLGFFTLNHFIAVNNSYVVNAKIMNVVLTKKVCERIQKSRHFETASNSF